VNLIVLVVAAASTGIPADKLVPAVGPTSLIGTEGADVTALGQGSLSLGFGFLSDPIQLQLPSGGLLSRPVHEQFTTDLAAEVGLWRRRLALSIGVPVVFWQKGDRLRGTGIDETPLAKTAAGDMRFRLKAALRATGRVHVAALVQVTVPLGGEHDFAATDSVTVEPRLMLDAHLAPVYLAFSLGVRFAGDRDLFQSHFGDALTWSAGIGVALCQWSWRYLALIGEAAGEVGGSAGSRPAEARGALRVGLGAFTLDAGAGGGLDGEVAAPAWRVFLIVRALVGRAR
jgi:hypothetical protein